MTIKEFSKRLRNLLGKKEFDKIFWNCVCGKKKIIKVENKGESLILYCECADEFIEKLNELNKIGVFL